MFLSTLSRILAGVTGGTLGQRGEATFLRSHSRGRTELEFDGRAPDPNPQPSFLRSSQLEVLPGFLRAWLGPWAVWAMPALPYFPGVQSIPGM